MALSGARTAVNSAPHEGSAYGDPMPEDPLIGWREHFADDNLESTEAHTLGVEGDRLQKTISQAFPGSSQDTWSYDDLQTAVRRSQSEWETKERIGKGKPQKLFHTCLGKLDAHSNLFSFVPSGDKYFTLLTCAVTILVKASTSHTKTIEALSKAIDTINDAAAHCSIESKLIRSRAMQNAVAKFYIAVFLFFGDAILWYKSSSKKKIMNSLQNDFSEKFRLSLDTIQHLSANVKRVAALGTGAEVRVVRLELEELQCELQDIRAGLTGQLRVLAELSHLQHIENIGYHQHTQALLVDYMKAPQALINQDTIRATDASPLHHIKSEEVQDWHIRSGRDVLSLEHNNIGAVHNVIMESELEKDNSFETSQRSSNDTLTQYSSGDDQSRCNAILEEYTPLTPLQHNSHPIELAQVANQWIRHKESVLFYFACCDQRSDVAFVKASWHMKTSLDAAKKQVIMCHPAILRRHNYGDTIEHLVLDLISQLIRSIPRDCVHKSKVFQDYVTATAHATADTINEGTWTNLTHLLTNIIRLVSDELYILVHCSDRIATLDRLRLVEIVSVCHRAVQASHGKILKVLVFSPKIIAIMPPLRQDQIKFFPCLSHAQTRIFDGTPT